MAALSVQMQPFFEWLLRSTLQASLVVCLILLVQAILRNRLGVRWHHALWLILVIRMVLPWAPQSRVSVFNVAAWWDQPREIHSRLAEQTSRPPAENSTERVAGRSTQSAPATSPQQPGSIAAVTVASHSPERLAPRIIRRAGDALPFLWALGAMALGTYVMISNLRLWQATSVEHPSTDKNVLDLLEECRTKIGLRTLVALVVSEKVRTPVLLGFIRPRLLLPKDIAAQLSREELRYVFLHELAHVKRHDIALAWLTALLQVLHWFNPLVWLAFHRMRADRELACDALVLTRTRGEGAKDYGRAIVSLLERFSFAPPLPGLAAILESKSQLKRRMTMITQFKNNSYRWSPLAVALVVILCCVSLPDAKLGKAAQPASASVSAEQPAAAPSGDGNVFVDPNTGIRFTKFRTISGPSDVIQYGNAIDLSPNGKFLLWEVHVVPLDGSAPFDLVNMLNAGRGSWSPDGRKVVFYCGAMWLIEVDPETGRPAGSPRKLLEGEYWYQFPVRWSLDSRRIVFARRDSQIHDQIWTISIESGEAAQVTDPFSFGLVSPDGKTVVCSEGQDVLYKNSLLMKSVTGGEVKKTADGVFPVAWSADSQWLVCKPAIGGGWDDTIRFVRVADGRQVMVDVPGFLIGQSARGKKLLFYRGSYDDKAALKVASIAGGPRAEFGWPNLSFEEGWAGYQWWAHDSRIILVEGKRGEGQWGLWTLPLDGKAPQPLTIDTPLCRQAYMRLFSPDGSKLLLVMGGIEGNWDLWAVPVSLAQMKSAGPPVKIFGDMVPPTRRVDLYPDTWSPDGSKIAFVHNWDIWVASADGKSVLQLTKTSEQDGWPVWSPDGTVIAFFTRSPTNLRVRVVPASGGEVRTIVDLHSEESQRLAGRPCAWFPSGKELTVISEDQGIIVSFPVAGGDPKTVVRLKDLGVERASWPTWSPDGRLLAFSGGTGRTDMKLYVYQPDVAKLQQLSDSDIAPFYWSPDGKWISYFSEQTVKTRPEGILWEMDVEEALAKLAK